VIEWNEAKHRKQFADNIQWRDCPEEHRPAIEGILKEYWDVFCPRLRDHSYLKESVILATTKKVVDTINDAVSNKLGPSRSFSVSTGSRLKAMQMILSVILLNFLTH
jgi:hypothetical protein